LWFLKKVSWQICKELQMTEKGYICADVFQTNLVLSFKTNVLIGSNGR